MRSGRQPQGRRQGTRPGSSSPSLGGQAGKGVVDSASGDWFASPFLKSARMDGWRLTSTVGSGLGGAGAERVFKEGGNLSFNILSIPPSPVQQPLSDSQSGQIDTRAAAGAGGAGGSPVVSSSASPEQAVAPGSSAAAASGAVPAQWGAPASPAPAAATLISVCGRRRAGAPWAQQSSRPSCWGRCEEGSRSWRRWESWLCWCWDGSQSCRRGRRGGAGRRGRWWEAGR